ncbi:hypothetical protein Nmel_005244, partial [Mimus melanotis]
SVNCSQSLRCPLRLGLVCSCFASAEEFQSEAVQALELIPMEQLPGVACETKDPIKKRQIKFLYFLFNQKSAPTLVTGQSPSNFYLD